MARPDFYVVLGVHRDATPARIRAAYRRLAQRHHPDHEGGSTGRFQEISEAYRTLSDPEARRAYDATPVGGPEAVGPDHGWSAPEPLRVGPLDVLDPLARFRPTFESLQERYLRNFVGGRAPKGEVVEALNVEVVLSVEEAMRGVRLPLEVPTLQACDACNGTGSVWLFPCTACRQIGRVLVPETVHLHLRPPVVSGSLLEIPLDRVGVRNFFLRVHPVVQ